MISKNLNRNNELVSVIVPCFNSEKFIKKTLNSVLCQTYKSLEIIIIDDCSDDNTLKIVKSLLRNFENKKIIENQIRTTKPRNIGIKSARGRYLAFIDHDDIWLNNKILDQVNFHKKTKCDISCTYYRRFNNKNKIGRLLKSPLIISYENLLKQNSVCMSSVMIDVVRYKDFFFLDNTPIGDFSTWLKSAKLGRKILTLNKDLTRYRIHNDQVSHHKKSIIKDRWFVLRSLEKLSLIKSTKYFIHYAFKSFFKYIIF